MIPGTAGEGPLKRLSRARRLRLGLVGFALGICLVGIALLGFDVVRKIDQASTATADAVQWTLSQTDVELLAFEVAVEDAMRPDSVGPVLKERVARVITRFDIFYSRVETLGQGELYRVLKNTPGFAGNYRELKDFIERVAPAMDGPRAALVADLPEIQRETAALRPKSRAMGLAGLRAYALRTERNRLSMVDTLLTLAGLTIVFILTLLALVVALMRLDRSNRARAEYIAAGAARLRTIVSAAQDAVITLDTHGRILAGNAAAERIFGYDLNQMEWADLGRLLFPAGQRAALAEAIGHPDNPDTPGEPKRHRLWARARDGREFPVELTVSATRSAAQVGVSRIIVAFLRDLTAEVAAEEELVAARDRALAGERAKADLLMVMSHEVRTPLNGLLGTLDLLGRTKLSERQRKYLRILETSGELLLHHVNAVLDISRLDKGAMPVAPAPLDLGALAREVIENQGAAAEAQGNALVLRLPEDGRVKVVSDGRLLRQVLLNLLGNAVKFTEGGRITLSIRHLGPDGPTRFEVEDTGIGIPGEDLDRVFDDFVTLDARYARRRGGSGLGLGIARRIVGRLGGELGVESAPGDGSIFRFTLDMPILEATAEVGPVGGEEHADAGPVAANAKGSGPLDLLMIEDNAINREVLRDMLVSLGHRVSEAVDGAEGLEMAQGRRFDAILMDISMPEMDGLQATEALRAGNGPNRETPILALTAHALPEEHRRFRALGMAGVLVKPFGLDALDAEIGRAVGEADGEADGEAEAATEDGGRKAPGTAKGPGMPPPHLVAAFLAEGDVALADIAALAGQPGAGEELRRAVHRLAGPAGLIGAAALAAKLGRIETLLKTGAAKRALAELGALPGIWARTKQDFGAEDEAEPDQVEPQVERMRAGSRA